MPFVISVIKCFAHWIVWIITKAFIIAVKSNIIRIMDTVAVSVAVVAAPLATAAIRPPPSHTQIHIGSISNSHNTIRISFTVWPIANHSPIYRNRALISYECTSGECVMMRLMRYTNFHHIRRLVEMRAEIDDSFYLSQMELRFFFATLICTSSPHPPSPLPSATRKTPIATFNAIINVLTCQCAPFVCCFNQKENSEKKRRDCQYEEKSMLSNSKFHIHFFILRIEKKGKALILYFWLKAHIKQKRYIHTFPPKFIF